MPVSELLKLARSRQAGGRHDEAEAAWLKVLQSEPEHADALHNLGLIAQRAGRSEQAVTLIRRAIAKEPANAVYFIDLGNIHEASGQLEMAIASYREAASLDPTSEWAHLRLGDALRQKGQLVEAAVSISRALTIRPDFSLAIKALADVLLKAGRLEQAVVCFRKAISLAPGYAEAHNNLGNALDKLYRREDAVRSYKQAILLDPALASVHGNLGRTLLLQDKLVEAVSSLQRAIELQPDFVEAHLNLGTAYRKLGAFTDAVRCYRHLLSLAPDHGAAHNNLATTYAEQGELGMANESYEAAIAARCSFPPAYSNFLYFQAFTRHVSPIAERDLARGWEKAVLTEGQRAVARTRALASSGAFPAEPLSGRKLRLGVVSSDLGDHPVSEFLEPFFNELDRSRFHLTLFPAQFRPEARAVRIHQLADSCIPLIDVPDEEALALIQSEHIDVLMDASGHTAFGRMGIFARRAAPVQCSYVGYWSTTGLTEMDWYITDRYCDRSIDPHFTEGLWRLPRLACCYLGDTILPESAWTPDPDGTVWLGSFNKYAKIREETLALWALVLKKMPETKLLFEDRLVNEDENRRRILTTLANHGVAQDRVDFIPCIPGHERHMKMYDRLDIALDTIPFNSGTTAYDALWMGVPLVTLQGDWLGGTLTGSVLKAFGREDWIAQNAEQYILIVRSLARDVKGRRILRKDQRALMAASPLCDAKGLTRALENAFEAMYSRWLGPTV